MSKILDQQIKQRTFIAAPPEKVYDTITSADGWDAFFTTGMVLDAKPGGECSFTWANWGPDKYTLKAPGKVVELQRPSLFVFQWGPEGKETTIRFELEIAEHGTIVTVTESGYQDSPESMAMMLECASGWGEAVTLLKFYLEHGIVYDSAAKTKTPALPLPNDIYHVSKDVYIDAPVERVFEAVTSADQWDNYFTTGMELEPKPGGVCNFRWKHFGPNLHTSESLGKVLEIDPPHRFVFEWGYPDRVSTARFELESKGAGTVLTLFEDGYEKTRAGLQSILECSAHWGELLTLIKFYVEKGYTYQSPRVESEATTG
jgi:uncharacterized protein YndB with AHSA1/START domain